MSDLNLTIRNIKNISQCDMELPLEKGLYAFVGENGCGKSTLMLAISLLVKPETTCQGLFSTVHRIFKKSTQQKPGAQQLPACSSKQIYAYQHKSSKGLKNLLLLLPKV